LHGLAKAIKTGASPAEYVERVAYMTDDLGNSASQFAAFVTTKWQGGFSHSYLISTDRSFARWRQMAEPGTVPMWSCESLQMAASRWSWRENKKTGTFEEIAGSLKKAMSDGDQGETLHQCFEIFKWGGVAQKRDDASRQWVRQRCTEGNLIQAIRDAVALLQPASTDTLDRFNSGDLLMNSAMTKVYAAADELGEVAIYDGRVGAALGLLARTFLESRAARSVPADLMFHWGPSRASAGLNRLSRDPSTPHYHFRQLPNGAHANQPRAEVSRRANRLFVDVRAQLAAVGMTVSSVDIERALFMVGYKVR
jgi:hypothetical protein